MSLAVCRLSVCGRHLLLCLVDPMCNLGGQVSHLPNLLDADNLYGIFDTQVQQNELRLNSVYYSSSSLSKLIFKAVCNNSINRPIGCCRIFSLSSPSACLRYVRHFAAIQNLTVIPTLSRKCLLNINESTQEYFFILIRSEAL